MTEPGLAPEEDIRTSVIDGVTVFWTPKAARSIASLQFRTGRGDEPFPLMGASHLAEHLALFPIRQRPYHTNGFVDHLRTVFHGTGTLEEVSEYLSEVTRNLGALPMDRLADESRVLRAEARSRVPAITDHLLWLRYGAQGYGGMIFDEHGLGSIDEASLRAWMADRYTTGNAVAWISGEPPAGLHFDLPLGTRRPTIALETIRALPLPAWAWARLPGIAVGVIVPRESAPTMGLRILTERLEQRLRYELGKSYEVSLMYLPLDATVGHGSLFASCLEADAVVVRDAFALVVEGFLSKGPTQDELDRDVERFERNETDPDRTYGMLERVTFNTLIGHPIDTVATLLAEMRSVTPETCRAAMQASFGSAILAGPVPTALGGHWNDYPSWSSGAVVGRRYDVASKRYPWSKGGAQLVVGESAVSWVSPEGRALTVEFPECIGMLEEGPTRRILWGRDGFSVSVDASEWRHGSEIVARIDAAIPRHLAVVHDPEV